MNNKLEIKYKNYIKKLRKYKIFVKSMNNKYISIPNLESNFVPQGICKIDNYYLITAYDYTKEKNSVIYVIDSNNKLINKVFLDGKYHSGGIAHHKESNSVYVTGASGINNGNSSYINKYNLKDILSKDKVYTTSKIIVDDNNTLKSSITKKSSAAYLTIYNNELYLGNFTWNSNGIIKKYNLDNNGNIILSSSTIIHNPYKKTQGICKCKYKEEYYYLFSTSYSRIKDSILYISKLNSNNKFITIKKINLPVMSEQLNITKEKEIYILFESGAKKYWNAKNRVKDICFFDFEKIIKSNKKIKVTYLNNLIKKDNI